MLGEELADLGFGEGAQANPDADPLAERLEPRFGEPVAQQLLAVGTEQVQVLQGVVRQQMGLIDEQDDAPGQEKKQKPG